MLTSPVDESNCISWAENTEELPSKHKHTAINPPTATRSTLEGKSITTLTICTESAEVAFVVRVLCMYKALAKPWDSVTEMEMFVSLILNLIMLLKEKQNKKQAV